MATDITPPGSVFKPPLTPPPTTEKPWSQGAECVVKHLRLHRAQHQLGPWWEIRLKPHIYSQVIDLLDADKSFRGYVEDKVRYDYDPYRHRLIIRMPCPLYDIFGASIADDILRQIRGFQRYEGLIGDFALGVKHFATSRILLPEDTDDGTQVFTKREPDISFGHDQALYPDDYILNTDGSINVVIALDIDYRGSQKATFTVWRPEYLKVDGMNELRAKAVIEADSFRTEDGKPAKGVDLRLSLQDFAPKMLSQNYGDLDQDILISSHQLCDFLSDAETRQRGQTQQTGFVNRIEPFTRKRRRTQTPSEHPSPEDEGRNKKIRANKRNSQSSKYRPSSSSRDSAILKV